MPQQETRNSNHSVKIIHSENVVRITNTKFPGTRTKTVIGVMIPNTVLFALLHNICTLLQFNGRNTKRSVAFFLVTEFQKEGCEVCRPKNHAASRRPLDFPLALSLDVLKVSRPL
jgi:hypothetical protein